MAIVHSHPLVLLILPITLGMLATFICCLRDHYRRHSV